MHERTSSTREWPVRGETCELRSDGPIGAGRAGPVVRLVDGALVSLDRDPEAVGPSEGRRSDGRRVVRSLARPRAARQSSREVLRHLTRSVNTKAAENTQFIDVDYRSCGRGDRRARAAWPQGILRL